jgi:circadian clock protein KaiC
MSTQTARFETGVPGLDKILHGGFVPNGLYVLIGDSGTAKTTLANQIAFSHHRNERPVIYVTILAEPHTRLLAHVRQFRFYQEQLVGRGISYISAFEPFFKQGFQGLSDFLRPIIRKERPSLLILDGVPLNPPDMPYDPALKGLVHDLQSYLEFTETTCLLLSTSHAQVWQSRVLMMVDGALELKKEVVGREIRRAFEIQILRGTSYEPGAYRMTLTDAGLAINADAPFGML